MLETHPITEIIRQRYSVRRYQKIPIAAATQAELQSRLDAIRAGPLGTSLRFKLVAAAAGDSHALRGLGTYGFIKNPTGFIVGAVQATEHTAAHEHTAAKEHAGAKIHTRAKEHTGAKIHALEDYGYALELAILGATALGLGTCWLGGSFTKSSFAKRINKHAGEIVPAVSSVGYAEADSRNRDLIRQRAHADHRLPWESLFFEAHFGAPLTPQSAGAYAEALEMLRLAPSASNKQPWRLIREDQRWHFYCQRTPGYGKGSLIFTLLALADLQRLDIGIAMCHFELTARQQGLNGAWLSADPDLPPVDKNLVYITSWQEEQA